VGSEGQVTSRMSALYPVAGALVLAVLCVVDSAPHLDAGAGYYASVIALAACIGMLQGTGLGVLQHVLARVSMRLRLAGWGTLAAGGAAWFWSDNSLPSMLGGHYPWLAAGLMFVSALAMAAVAVLGVAVPVAIERGGLRLRIAGAALLGAVGGAYWVDLAFYAGLYPHLHFALRLWTAWVGTFALAVSLSGLSWPRPPVWAWCLPLLATLGLGKLDAQTLPLGSLLLRPWPAFVLGLARDATDVDRDGDSALFGGGDCAPWNPRVYPGAREIPDNGVDDNCLLGDASRRIAPEERLPVPTQPAPMDIVLITIDALRPDHLGVYNPKYGLQGRGTSPAIDRFAARATVFTEAFSPGGGTNIAIGAMLRGIYPRRLQWTGYFETHRFKFYGSRAAVPANERITTMVPLAFDDPRKPMPLLLKQRGMFTAAVLDDGYSEVLSVGTGIEQGFSQFHETDARPYSERNDKGTAELMLRALRAAPKDRRMFLWAHFFGPHNPNTTHFDARVYGKSLVDGYDHEINYLDKQLGRVLAELERWPRPVAVFVTSDHGDVMANGRYHGYTITDDVVRVPLIARVPGWLPGKNDAVVSLIDVLPTILELTETPAPSYLDGVSLRRQLGPRTTRPPRVVFSDTWLYNEEQKPRTERSAVYDETGKLLLDRLTQERRLERVTDPTQETETFRRLSRALDGYLEDTGGTIALKL
jgi:Sulfatase